MSEQHLATEIHSWTAQADRRWFARCDLCRRRRLVTDYVEGYLYHDGKSVWLWACSECLIDEISDRLASAEQERDEIMKSYQEQKHLADAAKGEERTS